MLASDKDSSEIGLIGTIRVPRNLIQISDRLPRANYKNVKSELSRNQSLPVSIEHSPQGSYQNLLANEQMPSSARANRHPSNKAQYHRLPVIRERVDDNPVKSADPSITQQRAFAHYKMMVKNQAKGYNSRDVNNNGHSDQQNKENNHRMLPNVKGSRLSSLNGDRSSQLMSHGAHIISSTPYHKKSIDANHREILVPAKSGIDRNNRMYYH